PPNPPIASWRSSVTRSEYGGPRNGPPKLQPLGDEHAALGADGGLAGRVAQASPQLDDVAAQPRRRAHGDPEPLEADRLVDEHRPAEAKPEIESQHRRAAREVRRRQAHQEAGRLRAAGDRTAEARAGRIHGIVVNRVAVAGASRVVGGILAR